MKKAVKILGIVLGSLLVLAGGFVIYASNVYETRMQAPVEPLALQARTDSATLARGQQIVSLVCAHCHIGDDGTLSGRRFADPEEGFGVLWAANITRHPDALGRYTDGELAYVIRAGVNREGRFLGPFMMHPNMADEDLAAIVSFLRSDHPLTRPSDFRPPTTEYSTLLKGLITLGIFNPIPVEKKTVVRPDPADKLAYGKYLATDLYLCSNCHSASFETNDILVPENSPGFFGGGNPVADPAHTVVTPSANITLHPEHGIGKWTEEQFIRSVKDGISPDNKAYSPAMPRFNSLEDKDLSAIWAYLQTVPVLDNEVKPVTEVH